jgi:peptide/nickel transport system ATP-binding protein
MKLRAVDSKSHILDPFILIKDLEIESEEKGIKLLEVPRFEAAKGFITGIYGPSGTGKSLFLQTLALLTPVQSGLHVQGNLILDQMQIQFPLDNISTKALADLRKRRFAMIQQEPTATFNPNRTIQKHLDDVLKYNPSASQFSLSSLLQAVDLLQVDPNRFPQEYSGGQLQRWCAVCAILQGAEVLLCDEPTASLDSLQKNNFMKIVQSVAKDFQVCVLLVSHDQSMLSQYCDSMYCFDSNASSDIQPISAPIHQRTSDQEFGINLMEIKGLSYSYKEKGKINQVLNDVNLAIQDGSFNAIIGPSGCGKSTLSKILTGQLKSYSGNIFWKGKCVQSMPFGELLLLWASFAYIPQDALLSLNPAYNVGALMRQAVTDTKEESFRDLDIKDLFNLLRLDIQYHDKYAYQLSGGERQRVNIARMMIHKPTLCIFDEAMSGIDEWDKPYFMDWLLNLLHDMGSTMIWITHNYQELTSDFGQVLVMQDGRVVESGQLIDLRDNPNSVFSKMMFDRKLGEK